MAKKGLAHEWRARTSEIDFLRKEGGFYGVILTLSTDMAKRFCRNIERCVKLAETNRKGEIEIMAHWGKKKAGGGYLLRNRVKKAT